MCAGHLCVKVESFLYSECSHFYPTDEEIIEVSPSNQVICWSYMYHWTVNCHVVLTGVCLYCCLVPVISNQLLQSLVLAITSKLRRMKWKVFSQLHFSATSVSYV